MVSRPVSRRTVLRSAVAAGLVSAGLPSSATAVPGDGSQSAQSGWPTFGGTEGNTFYDVDGSGPREDLSVEWSTELGRPSGVVDDRGIYVAGDRLMALTDDGSVRWERNPDGQHWQLPSLGEEHLYSSDQSEIHAVDPESGETDWSIPVEAQFAEALEVGDTAYCLQFDFGSNGREMVTALDRDTGDERWSRSSSPFWFLTPTEDRVYCSLRNGAVVALDPASGSRLWQFDADDIEQSFVAVFDGVVYVPGNESIYAIDGADGTERWSTPHNNASSRVLVDGELVYGTEEGGVASYDAETGTERWTNDDVSELLAGVGDTLYARNGRFLQTLDRSDGTVVDTLETDSDVLWNVAVSDGTLYYGQVNEFSAITGTSSTTPADVTVSVGPNGEYVFEPGTDEPIEVEPGTTIEFVWASDGHNIVVENQPAGASWDGVHDVEHSGYTHTHTFEVEGTYEFYCAPHESLDMTGTIVVGGSQSTGGGGGTATNSEEGDAGSTDTEAGDRTSAGGSTADNANFGGSDSGGQPGLGVLSALGGLGAAAARLLRRGDGDA